MQRVAIQGELGSNSHMAARQMLGEQVEIVPCAVSHEVLDAVVAGRVDGAVLPIENSLHGSVAEHYDLLLERPVAIMAESLLRIRHNLIAMPGVQLSQLRHVLSHPVALSQCRRFLREHPELQAMPFYDTAGSVKELMQKGLRDTAGIAPELAAQQYGGQVLLAGIEDHTENYTRFHLIQRRNADTPRASGVPCNKLSLAFTLQHRPGTLVAALELLASAGVNLTKIESRPVQGSPWEYVFYVDVRYEREAMVDQALEALKQHCGIVKELGRYVAA
ncbi:MAG: prephenate dehydratase [Acidobacteriota bacterium]|nr:prephenate dehydratase [Acidobacteriota bacterium]